MKFIQKNKTTLMALVFIVLAIILYKTFFSSLTAVSTQSAEAQNVGQDLVALYNNLQAVTLDRTIFSTPAYRSLMDYSVPLAPQPTGRPNPFDLIGK